jgi:hypothetical protein
MLSFTVHCSRKAGLETGSPGSPPPPADPRFPNRLSIGSPRQNVNPLLPRPSSNAHTGNAPSSERRFLNRLTLHAPTQTVNSYRPSSASSPFGKGEPDEPKTGPKAPAIALRERKTARPQDRREPREMNHCHSSVAAPLTVRGRNFSL